MNVFDEFKEKIIIVADHTPSSGQMVVETLKSSGFLDIRHIDSGEKIYDILRPLHDQPDRIALILLKEGLPNCQVEELCQSLTGAIAGSVIPILIIGETAALPQSQMPANSPQLDNALTHRIVTPFSERELLTVINFLLLLKQDRFLQHQQEERLVNELAEKSLVDAKLKFLASHDELTGLLNRNCFETQLKLALNLSKRLHKDSALLFIDIDRFNLVNELEGFAVGDNLLVELGVLVRKLIPAKSLFARIGGDEFCVFLDNMTAKQATVLAEHVKTAVENFRFYTGEVCYSATISIGISSLDGSTPCYHPGEMILYARQACNLAKVCGRDKIWVYSRDDHAIKERRLDIYWVPIIRKALLEHNLHLVFQPVVQLNNGYISHYEVLLRMRGEDDKTITPDKFIPAAERMGLIHAIDLWVVEHAIDFLAALPSYLSHVSLAINLSGTAFQYPDLFQTIQDKLELTWVNANRLTFEITETSAVENFEKTRDMINKIRALGCKFALDDFGAGFCSFNYLKTFPVDYVKIDGQFIRNIITDETDQILVKSMVDIATKLGKKTIAEFVESPLAALKLKEVGVHLGQGYLFGKPERHLLDSNNLSMPLLLNGPNGEAGLPPKLAGTFSERRF